jgi:hypothetical protein|nr:MAG TPA: hypothetical protein [Caudoviricetes sp.]
MAFEIVDGMTGTKHISSDDLSALNVATIGKANCVLEYSDNFKLTMASANEAKLGTGVGMVGGKRFWNQAATSLTVQSGTQGQKRNDLVVARYAKTSAGIESITPVVIKGTPSTGTAADPATTSNDLKLWRIPLNGISVGTPVKLFDTVAPLATLKDFVFRVLARPGITFKGTVTVPGLKKHAVVIVVFSRGQHAIMPTADGTHVVSGAMGGNNAYSVTTASAMASVSGETVTFEKIGYNTYMSPKLGYALTLAAGDDETITAIYG